MRQRDKHTVYRRRATLRRCPCCRSKVPDGQRIRDTRHGVKLCTKCAGV